jgi:carboxypeptidase C (cathepsin A)
MFLVLSSLRKKARTPMFYFRVQFLPILALSFIGINSVAAAEKPNDHVISEPTKFITEHAGRFNGERIEYTVTAGETYLRDIKGEPTASLFSFSYVKSVSNSEANRPITFIWNGGPGSASTWLHMGGYGPKRIVVPSDGTSAGTPPYPMADAPETILDVSDLVFIDPVGTGYSRALGDHEPKELWGLNEDANSMADFIRLWITENKRWNSPKFLLGESFGTTRAALVAHILEGELSIRLNGVVFISQALDYQGSTPYVRDNIISHITYVPSMAATALYHKKIQPVPPSLESFLQDAREFAINEYLPALFKGSTISREEFVRIRDRLAYFTGLSPAYVEQANLRVQGNRFRKELLRDRGLAVGSLDSRYVSDEIDDLAATADRDAASDGISSAYRAALMSYLANDLDVTWGRQYLDPSDPELSKNWRWRTVPEGTSWEPSFVNTARDLSAALRINPSLKVLVASGYYDMVTPFFDAEYTLNRHDIESDRLQYEYYEGGHMMYVNDSERLKLLEDTRAFIKQQAP